MNDRPHAYLPGARRPSRLGGVTLVALVVALLVAGFAWWRPLSASSDETPQTVSVTLVAQETEVTLHEGTTVRAWTYNGQLPGPEIRVREGDRLRVTLVNQLPVPTSIHWHGVELPPEMDGPAGLNQEPVEPGQDFVYEFIAGPAGSRMYHSHTDVTTQIALGLYGSLIIEPKKPAVEFDREYTYMLSEWDLEMTPDVATGKAPRGPRDSQLRGGELGTDLFLMNGRIHDAIPPVQVKEGERVLLRLMNMGSLAHPIHIHGHSFKIVATDGNPVPEAAQVTKDTVLVAPGERYDILLEAVHPGVWMVHCHIEHHAANGMMTLLEYEGEVPTGPLKEMWNGGTAPISKEGALPAETGAGDSHAHGSAAGVATPAAEAEVDEPAPAADEPGAEGDEAIVLMLDDRFEVRDLVIPAGTTVTWVNKGADWHSVAAADGSFESEKIAPGDSFSVTFDTPGTYGYICKHHARQGMFGKIVVT